MVLRGGSEAIHSNNAIGRILQAQLEKMGLPKAAVQVIMTTDRNAVNVLLEHQSLQPLRPAHCQRRLFADLRGEMFRAFADQLLDHSTATGHDQ